MKLNEIKPAAGSTKKSKRVGRGPGSGHGKTATRGHKGQKARTGGGVKAGFEGGQMPLQRRLPKRGFTNKFKVEFAVINVKDIDKCGLDTISIQSLSENGMLKDVKGGLKILGTGEIKRAVKVQTDAISASAKAKIEAAGGSVEVL